MDIVIILYGIIILGITSAWGTIKLIESVTINSEREVKECTQKKKNYLNKK